MVSLFSFTSRPIDLIQSQGQPEKQNIKLEVALYYNAYTCNNAGVLVLNQQYVYIVLVWVNIFLIQCFTFVVILLRTNWKKQSEIVSKINKV